MPAKALIDQISVETPCKADWNSMIGNDEVRFCKHCNLSVHNLSALTRKQVSKLIAQSGARLCVQYVRRPDGLMATAELRGKLHQIARRASRIASGALTATLSVTAAAQQSYPEPPNPPRSLSGPYLRQNIDEVRVPPGRGGVSGTVTDQNGALIVSATISLFRTDNGLALYASTNSSGEFRFEQLAAGQYSLRAEAPGFAPNQVFSVYVPANASRELNQTLRIESIEETVEIQVTEQVTLGGAVAIVAPRDPLVRAAQQDDLETVTELIAGKDVNLRDKVTKTTALEHAVRNANREMVQLLITAGANVNLENAIGETVIMMMDSDSTSDLAWDLINAGAKLNVVDVAGNTPLIEVADSNNPDVLKTLLEAGAQVNAKNSEGKTALMIAAAEGLVNNVRALILAGADINAIDTEGKNALFYASDNDRTPVIRLLRMQGSAVVLANTESQ